MIGKLRTCVLEETAWALLLLRGRAVLHWCRPCSFRYLGQYLGGIVAESAFRTCRGFPANCAIRKAWLWTDCAHRKCHESFPMRVLQKSRPLSPTAQLRRMVGSYPKSQSGTSRSYLHKARFERNSGRGPSAQLETICSVRSDSAGTGRLCQRLLTSNKEKRV